MAVASATMKRMTMPDIKNRAKELGIVPRKMRKTELIHAIQMAEGCTPCFGRSDGQCPWLECCWRADCLKTQA